MKKRLLSIFAFLLSSFVFLSTTSPVHAESCNAPATGVGVTFPAYPATQSHTITLDMSNNFDEDRQYRIVVEEGTFNKDTSPWFPLDQNINTTNLVVQDKVVTWTITDPDALENTTGAGNNDDYAVDLEWRYSLDQCDIGTYTVERTSNPGSGCQVEIYQNRNNQTCYQNNTQNACFAQGITINFNISGLKDAAGNPWNGPVGLRITELGAAGEWDGAGDTARDGEAELSFTPDGNTSEYQINVAERRWWNQEFTDCQFSVETQQGCNEDQCAAQTELGNDPSTLGPDEFKLCQQINDPEARGKCETCAGGADGTAGIWTAVGCIKREPEEILGRFIRLGIGIGGGVALLMILAAGFQLTISQGNAQKTAQAKEMVTAAITGLLFIIFSVTILHFIGFSILKIPGFGA